MEIFIATNNIHKAEELDRLFKDKDEDKDKEIKILLPQDKGIDFSFDENGNSYLENAIGKARALYNITGRPVISDDSGLSVPALGGEPGIHSARYGARNGINLSDKERNEFLLSKMRCLSDKSSDRNAFFVCCMVLLLEEYRFFVAQDTVSGYIAEKPSGSGGFGYDPIFFVPEHGKTMSELTPDEKDRISHRGRAARRIFAVIRKGNFIRTP